jgi:hypothetical protein
MVQAVCAKRKLDPAHYKLLPAPLQAGDAAYHLVPVQTLPSSSPREPASATTKGLSPRGRDVPRLQISKQQSGKTTKGSEAGGDLAMDPAALVVAAQRAKQDVQRPLKESGELSALRANRGSDDVVVDSLSDSGSLSLTTAEAALSGQFLASGHRAKQHVPEDAPQRKDVGDSMPPPPNCPILPAPDTATMSVSGMMSPHRVLSQGPVLRVKESPRGIAPLPPATEEATAAIHRSNPVISSPRPESGYVDAGDEGDDTPQARGAHPASGAQRTKPQDVFPRLAKQAQAMHSLQSPPGGKLVGSGDLSSVNSLKQTNKSIGNGDVPAISSGKVVPRLNMSVPLHSVCPLCSQSFESAEAVVAHLPMCRASVVFKAETFARQESGGSPRAGAESGSGADTGAPGPRRGDAPQTDAEIGGGSSPKPRKPAVRVPPLSPDKSFVLKVKLPDTSHASLPFFEPVSAAKVLLMACKKRRLDPAQWQLLLENGAPAKVRVCLSLSACVLFFVSCASSPPSTGRHDVGCISVIGPGLDTRRRL